MSTACTMCIISTKVNHLWKKPISIDATKNNVEAFSNLVYECNTIQTLSHCVDDSDRILLFSVHSKSPECSQSKGCNMWYGTLMDDWLSVKQRQCQIWVRELSSYKQAKITTQIIHAFLGFLFSFCLVLIDWIGAWRFSVIRHHHFWFCKMKIKS